MLGMYCIWLCKVSPLIPDDTGGENSESVFECFGERESHTDKDVLVLHKDRGRRRISTSGSGVLVGAHQNN